MIDSEEELLFLAKKEGKVILINQLGEQKIKGEYEELTVLTGNYSQNWHFSFKIQGKWGLMDKNGQIILPSDNEEISFSNNIGLIGFKKNGLWGLLKEDESLLSPPRFSRMIKDNYTLGNNIFVEPNGRRFTLNWYDEFERDYEYIEEQ